MGEGREEAVTLLKLCEKKMDYSDGNMGSNSLGGDVSVGTKYCVIQ